MRLHPHPESPPPPGLNLEAFAIWKREGLQLEFRLAGPLDGLLLPGPDAPRREEGLWRHTCFEAFFQGEDAPGYGEVNLAPSLAWQVYRFHAYRAGGALETSVAPVIQVASEASALVLRATLPQTWLGPGNRLRIGLTAVIETRAGALSYWSLSHPPGQPDFHDTRAFVLELDRP
ncbi:MAG: DOMON-like domain-containing protein [Betaproteobacteria bacterium]|nr:DOMON-like domain-containing protein [Betaproteobacteria bacterium]